MKMTCVWFWITGIVMFGACSTPADEETTSAIQVELAELRVENENYCTSYDRSKYRYSQSVEPRIVERQGGAFSPYDGTCFSSLRDSQIEHIVAAAEAHRSGMCSRSDEDKSVFASDLLNLTLATQSLNIRKSDKDFAEWKPPQNECWFAAQIVKVKKKYDLSVDRKERDALSLYLGQCESTAMVKSICN